MGGYLEAPYKENHFQWFFFSEVILPHWNISPLEFMNNLKKKQNNSKSKQNNYWKMLTVQKYNILWSTASSNQINLCFLRWSCGDPRENKIYKIMNKQMNQRYSSRIFWNNFHMHCRKTALSLGVTLTCDFATFQPKGLSMISWKYILTG